MIDDSELYMDSCCGNGRPQWYKCWAEKYANALDVENLNTDLSSAEKEELFKEAGIVFINSLLYFLDYDNETYRTYKPRTRDGRILWNHIKADIDQSYRDYDKRVMNGAKGGRPKKDLN